MPKQKALTRLHTDTTIYDSIYAHVKKLLMGAPRAVPVESLSYVMNLEKALLQVIYDASGKTAAPFCAELFTHYPRTDTPTEEVLSAQAFVESVIACIAQATVALENKAALLQILKHPNIPPEVKMTAFVKVVVAAVNWENPKLASEIIKLCDSVDIKKEMLKNIAHIDVQVLTNPKAAEKIEICRGVLKDLVHSFNYTKEWRPRDTAALMEGVKPHALDYLKRNVLKVVPQDDGLLVGHKTAALLSFGSEVSGSTGSASTGLFTSIQSTSTQGAYLGSPSSGATPAFFGDSKEGDEIDITGPYSPHSPRKT